MSRKMLSSLSNFTLYKDEVPDASDRGKGFAHSMLNAIRKTLSASSVSYLETLQETETNNEPVEEKLTDNMANYDMEEAIRQSILDSKRNKKNQDNPYEIELGQFYTNDSRPIYEDEGPSSGRMTPSSGMSPRLQPSSSSGVTFQDLYSVLSNEST